jgi:hypothetical protein
MGMNIHLPAILGVHERELPGFSHSHIGDDATTGENDVNHCEISMSAS